NGRDAIGEQGVLTFSSTKITDYSQYQKFKLSNKIDYAVLSVSDTGHGIKESDMNKIFDPFFTTKEVGKGTGIGLATTISIVKDYQGFIDVKSKINFGTTFTIILPLSNKKIEKKEEVIASTVQSKMKLLLVDDEEIILEIVSEMISSLGHQVEIANSGQKALEILKTNQNFDCIFVDRRMPEMDGNELFYQIKEINENIRVIMASGNAEDDEITKLREDGLYEYFTKPYKIADLVKFFQKFNAK
ncbi:MAG: response regulator, partial [Candidatus Cloacimonadota bacterium]|nr:response regulator [Candidatus Cloacimonadota bacterium]